MCKKIFYFLTGIALATCAIPANAANSVGTVPEGMITFTLTSGKTSYLSLPLTNNAIYTSVVTAVTTDMISVDDTPAPFTTNLATPAVPYFIKFLSGSESGRVMLITANTTNSLTMDTTDHITGSAVALTTTRFDVQVGDAFEIFPGDTLATVFGNGATHSPLLLTGGSTIAASDTIALFTTVSAPSATYYFNTTAGYWEQTGTTANANNTIIYPYSAFTITRLASHPGTTIVLTGRITQVAAETKLVSGGAVYTSSHYATDIKLSQLQFGSNWATGVTMSTSDNLSVWNATLGKFDVFYQKPDSTWRKFPDATTDQSNFTIAAGTVTTIATRSTVSGATSFLQSSLPYTLD